MEWYTQRIQQSHNLIFECEYLNGQKNGKAKEYNNEGQLKFEGEYLYGHKKQGKEYFNGYLEFEGEYLFDKKWKGKVYDNKGNIIDEIICVSKEEEEEDEDKEN